MAASTIGSTASLVCGFFPSDPFVNQPMKSKAFGPSRGTFRGIGSPFNTSMISAAYPFAANWSAISSLFRQIPITSGTIRIAASGWCEDVAVAGGVDR